MQYNPPLLRMSINEHWHLCVCIYSILWYAPSRLRSRLPPFTVSLSYIAQATTICLLSSFKFAFHYLLPGRLSPRALCCPCLQKLSRLSHAHFLQKPRIFSLILTFISLFGLLLRHNLAMKPLHSWMALNSICRPLWLPTCCNPASVFQVLRL